MASSFNDRFNLGPHVPPLYSIPDGNVLTVARRYPYRKLEGSTKIRLLKLYPESYENTASRILGRKLHELGLFGSLIEVDLAGEPSYECLSYTWGQSDGSRVIWLDDQVIPINLNLWAALLTLQLEDQPRLLWVDFVCINQLDLEERRNQVQLMYEIYSKASKVVAYLGTEADGSDNVPGLLQKIFESAQNEMFGGTDEKLKRLYCTPWSLQSSGLPPAEDPGWEALRKFLSRPWFFRVWILQEAVAARNLEILCGRWGAPAEFIFAGLMICISHRFPTMNFSLEKSLPWEVPNIKGCAQVTLMHQLGVCRRTMRNSHQKKRNEWALMEALERSRYASSSDPRDRVFALLNLCKEGKENAFHPDYTETVRATFIRTAKFLIRSGHGSRVLLNASLSDPSLELPSWVPDWSYSNYPSENPAPMTTEYGVGTLPTAGGEVVEIDFGGTEGQICVSAYRIGEINFLNSVRKYRYNRPFSLFESVNQALDLLSTGHTSEESSRLMFSGTQFPENGSDWPPLFSITEELSDLLKKSSRYTETDHSDIIWRTMVCSPQPETVEESREDYTQPFKSFIDMTRCQYDRSYLVEKVIRVVDMIEKGDALSDTTTRSSPELPLLWQHFENIILGSERFHSEARRFCFHMRTAMTGSGYVGMVPQQAQAADIVTIIKGVPVPMILRPTNDGPCFKMIGQAYFYGFMHGEIFTKEELKEEVITLV